ncbi:MAG: hypothetical protein ACFFAN_11230 [Promethearchaeota archaeon]
MAYQNIKVFKLNYSGKFEEISLEASSDLISFFTLFDILAIYVSATKVLWIWIGKKVTQSLNKYIPEIRTRFSEIVTDSKLKILRNITIESGSEPSDFFKFIGFTWEELKSHIKSQELKLKPIIDEIEALKNELSRLFNSEKYEEGIKISEMIIELSKKINDKSLEKEQKDLILELKEKAKLKVDRDVIEGETIIIKDKFDELIDSNRTEDIVNAHKIVEKFKKKYENIYELTSIPLANELILKEENIWFNFTIDQKDLVKKVEILINLMETAIENNDVSEIEETMTKAKELLLRIIDNDEVKKKWNKVENSYVEWKKKNLTIDTIEKAIEESSKLMEKFRFEESISKIDATMELIQDEEILKYTKKLKEIRKQAVEAQENYIKAREKIAVLEERISANRRNKQLNAALIHCEKIIKTSESINRHDNVLKYTQILEEIKKELEVKKSSLSKDRAILMVNAKELENVIKVDNNVLPLIEEFSVIEILGNLSDDINETLVKVGNLLNEHRVEVKNKIFNKALLISETGEIAESEQSLEVQEKKEDEKGIKCNVQSSLVNPFDNIIEEAILTDLVPYNFEIINIQLNGEQVKGLPDNTLTKEGIELEWKIQNVPIKGKIEREYELRRRISRTIIFILKGEIKIIKTHSNLNLMNFEGLYEAKMPFTNSFGSEINGLIIEDIIPLHYLRFIKEPSNLLPAEISSSTLGELVKWNVETMDPGIINYHYRLLELYRLEEIKININVLSKDGINALNKGDLTEAFKTYDKIINQLEEFNI